MNGSAVLRVSAGMAVATLLAASGASAAMGHGHQVAAHGAADRTVASGPAGANSGPPYPFRKVLSGEFESVSLKNQADLLKTKHGYRIWTGQQTSHLVVTQTDSGLMFRDTGTAAFKKLAPQCTRVRHISPGIEAVCKIPADVSVSHPLLIEVWPRLGDDYTDTSSLSAEFNTVVLSDQGNDVAHFGAGDDFFNGGPGDNSVWGGDGNDWIRTGIGNDTVFGEGGNDNIVAAVGNNIVDGGPGDDRIWGGPGDDTLRTDTGADSLLCGPGTDTAVADSESHVYRDCESVTASLLGRAAGRL